MRTLHFLVIAGLVSSVFLSIALISCSGGSSDNATNSTPPADNNSGGNNSGGNSSNGMVLPSSYDSSRDYARSILIHPHAYVSSQCYTKTIDDNGKAHNPCYSCHVNSQEPNYINDGDLQLAYAFATPALENPWRNLFKDRSAQVAAISDTEILNYINVDNYQDNEGRIIIAEVLKSAMPPNWDVNGNGQWDGYIPDLYYNFDEEGFDRDPSGNFTGWRAFAYTPFLGTFWPTNGSTDDVLIRLGEAFRKNARGEWDLDVYKVNLAIVEALIQRRDVQIDPVDETAFGVDLDKNGLLGTTDTIVYDWAPLAGRFMSYVGQAKDLYDQGRVHIAAGLYPEGTEFIHSVRYIGVDDDGNISMAKRLKELRYGKKTTWYTYAMLEDLAMREFKERRDFPDRLRQFVGNSEFGLSNNQGWVYQGFIENKEGDLRPQTYEETAFCIGCHGGIGAVTDGTFAFPRKLSGAAYRQGWYHWRQKNLQGTPEPIRQDGRYEYSYYLENNSAGDEFRNNDEVKAKFFHADDTLKADQLTALHDDITTLLFPSAERALELNKAYRAIVAEQSFIDGRDPTVTPMDHVVWRSVREEQPTGLTAIIEGPHAP